METPRDNRITNILTELYALDPDLERFKDDLPQIIATFEAYRPEIILNEKFVAELRTSLLAKQVKPLATMSTPVASPYLWWFSRLAPVGVVVGLLMIMLIPDRTKSPTVSTPPLTPTVTPADTEMEMQTFGAPPADDSLLFKAAPVSEFVPAPLEVTPPIVGSTLSILSLNAPAAGWLVVYEDRGGEFGDILSRTLVSAGEYSDLQIALDRPLRYPEMITVVLYTATNTEQFVAAAEMIQTDPQVLSPIMITIPVVSELELELME